MGLEYQSEMERYEKECLNVPARTSTPVNNQLYCNINGGKSKMAYKNCLDCSQEDYYALVCALGRYMNSVKEPVPKDMCAIVGLVEGDEPCTSE